MLVKKAKTIQLRIQRLELEVDETIALPRRKHDKDDAAGKPNATHYEVAVFQHSYDIFPVVYKLKGDQHKAQKNCEFGL